MITNDFARAFADEWIAAWNSHDLDRILSHYSDDFEMSSRLIVQRMNEPSGRLQGKAAIRTYWELGLKQSPPLRFSLLDVFAGPRSIVIRYRNQKENVVTEVFEFNDSGQVISSSAHYAIDGL